MGTPEELEALIEAKPLAQRLAADPATPPLNGHGGDRKADTSTLSDNVDDRGTGAAYLVRRLKRDAPQIAEDMTPSQRAMCAARASELYEEQAKQRMSEGGKAAGKGRPKQGKENLPSPIPSAGQARDQAGKAFGVSGKSVNYATHAGVPGSRRHHPGNRGP